LGLRNLTYGCCSRKESKDEELAQTDCGARKVADDSSISVFTGAELALADTMILLMKVMSMHDIIDSASIRTVFDDLEKRYNQQNLHGAAAMADYLRQHAGHTDRETLVRPQAMLNDAPRDPA